MTTKIATCPRCKTTHEAPAFLFDYTDNPLCDDCADTGVAEEMAITNYEMRVD